MEYSNFINKHQGENIIVCGCGKSLSTLTNPQDFITIGVNDIERLFVPNYLVILNNRHGFKDDRWNYVSGAKCPHIFTHIKDIGIVSKHNIVPLTLGTFGKLNLDDKTKVDYSSNSPYVAAVIAYQMGAKNIGMIGVDFTQDHFFNKSGRHPLAGRLTSIIKEYETLHKEFKSRGVNLYNLSAESLVKSIPYKSLNEFKNGL